nr:hypothetical protein B0A51_00761 [Rachicladosporium sp. CCFEE 5018]
MRYERHDFAQNLMSNDDIEQLRKKLKSTASGKWAITLDSAPNTLGVDKRPETHRIQETTVEDADEGESGSIAARRKSHRNTGVAAEPVRTPAKSSAKQSKKQSEKDSLEGAGEQIDDSEARPPPYKKLRTLSNTGTSPESIRPRGIHYKTVRTSKGTLVIKLYAHKTSMPGGVARSNVLKSAAAGASRNRSQHAAVGETSASKHIEYGELEHRQILDQASGERQSDGEQEEKIEDDEGDGEDDEET